MTKEKTVQAKLDILDLDEETINKLGQTGYIRRPHVKFVRKIEPIREAIFFAGGEESANQVIEWVMMHGDFAVHVSNQSGMIPEWIRIVGADDFTGDDVRSAARPNQWLVYEGNGVYSRVLAKSFEEEYQKLTIDEEGSDV